MVTSPRHLIEGDPPRYLLPAFSLRPSGMLRPCTTPEAGPAPSTSSVVAPGRWPTTGPKLLRTAISDAAARGAIQAVVVTANLDEPKREALRSCGLSIASEWWVTSWPPKAGDADATQAESRH
jgi:hypothetical protein